MRRGLKSLHQYAKHVHPLVLDCNSSAAIHEDRDKNDGIISLEFCRFCILQAVVVLVLNYTVTCLLSFVVASLDMSLYTVYVCTTELLFN